MWLIDANALKKKADMRGRCLRPLVTAFQLCVTVHDIDDAPTIDPESLRPQGKWIRGKLQNGERLSRCSACGERCRVPTCVGKPIYDYCPNCGAKMKGAENNDYN